MNDKDIDELENRELFGELTKLEQKKRMSPRPETLLGTLQDKVHIDKGKPRAIRGKKVRRSEGQSSFK